MISRVRGAAKSLLHVGEQLIDVSYKLRIKDLCFNHCSETRRFYEN